MAFHGIPYVATASVSYPDDYIEKIRKAQAIKDGLAYIHVLSPCPTGWRSPVSSTIELGRMAVETNYFPLWEADHGRFRFTYLPKHPRPVKEFTKLMQRFAHFTEQDLDDFQKNCDTRFALIKRQCSAEVLDSEEFGR
jgi:pyruvate/2-oxoacid:ferredoxin oxidoreductase beta subunit